MQNYKNLFTKSYEECRGLFNSFSASTNGAIFKYELPSVRENDLSIDSLYLRTEAERKRLIVICSGIHGIETYVCSVLQQIFWYEIGKDLQKNSGTDILLVHGINSYGFKNWRRFTENNVDLNRNCDSDYNLYSTENRLYTAVNGILNPKSAIRNPFLEELTFLFKMTNAVLKYGSSQLNDSIPKGQYQYPEGIFYGGNKPEPHLHIIKENLIPIIEQYKYVLLLDLHTGVGDPRRMHIIEIPTMNHLLPRELMDDIFSGFSIDGSDSGIHKETGSFLEWILKITPGSTTILPMLFDFGTIGSMSLIGGLKTLSRVIRENQMHHYGYKNIHSAQDIKAKYIELFYPSDSKWRESVITQFIGAAKSIISRFVEKCK